jgi:HlyD family secretion protein
MTKCARSGWTLSLVAVLVPLAGLLGYVAVRSGPLAPVAVTQTQVRMQSLRPSLFGIGTVEARYTFKLGPTIAGRLQSLEVDVGDRVRAGQVLGEVDPVDLDDRIHAQQAAFKRAQAAMREANARQTYARDQSARYEQLSTSGSTSEETVMTKRHELAVAEAAMSAAQEELSRVRADLGALAAQRGNLRLIAPSDGIVTARDVEPGTTVVAGQTVVEIIDPDSVWLHVRLDQVSASGVAPDLPVRIHLRSRGGELIAGRVVRVEPKADTVTEETLIKVAFDALPTPLPPLGELAEVTVDLAALPSAPTIPNAAIQRQGDVLGVWKIEDGEPRFVPVKVGRASLQGDVQILDGLKAGDPIVVYSAKALTPASRVHIVSTIAGARR